MRLEGIFKDVEHRVNFLGAVPHRTDCHDDQAIYSIRLNSYKISSDPRRDLWLIGPV